MRVVYRIIYAMIIAIGLYLTIDLTNSTLVTRHINEQGTIALEEDDFSHFIAARYYHQTPLIEDDLSIDAYRFRVLVFNVGNVISEDETLKVVEGFQIILHQTEGPDFPIPFTGDILTDNPNINMSYVGMRLADLPIYTFVASDSLSIFFGKSNFVENDAFVPIKTLEITRADDVLASYALNIEESDFQLTEILGTYIEANGEAPTQDYDLVGYSPAVSINTRPQVYLNTAIYVVAATLLTVLTFVIKKKYMGRREATEGLRKDIERLKDTRKEEKR